MERRGRVLVVLDMSLYDVCEKVDLESCSLIEDAMKIIGCEASFWIKMAFFTV